MELNKTDISKLTNKEEGQYERETVIIYNEYENNAEITTYDRKLKSKLEKNKEIYIKDDKDDRGTFWYIELPKEDLTICLKNLLF